MTATLIVCTVLLAAAYRVSLWWNPNRPCYNCAETGRHRDGVIFWWSRGRCRACSGSGARPRAGSRITGRK